MAFTAKILSWRFHHLNIVGCLLKRRPTKGGSWVTQEPPQLRPCMVTTGNTRPVIIFVNIEQNFLFFCVLETWPQERKLCLSLFILRNGCPLNIGFSAEQNFQNELPIIILSTILIFGNIGNLKKTIVSVKKILEK